MDAEGSGWNFCGRNDRGRVWEPRRLWAGSVDREPRRTDQLPGGAARAGNGSRRSARPRRARLHHSEPSDECQTRLDTEGCLEHTTRVGVQDGSGSTVRTKACAYRVDAQTFCMGSSASSRGADSAVAVAMGWKKLSGLLASALLAFAIAPMPASGATFTGLGDFAG